MEVVLLIEFEAGAAERAALLERVGALALTGRGQLSFVGADSSTEDKPARDVVALSLPTQGAAENLLTRWRSEGVVGPGNPARILRLQPLWSMEPLALMFP